MSGNAVGKVKLLVFGAASAGLYFALYNYNSVIVEAAQKVRAGDKSLFLVPVVIAFVFSFVHGAFTGHFWDALGFKPAAKKKG